MLVRKVSSCCIITRHEQIAIGYSATGKGVTYRQLLSFESKMLSIYKKTTTTTATGASDVRLPMIENERALGTKLVDKGALGPVHTAVRPTIQTNPPRKRRELFENDDITIMTRFTCSSFPPAHIQNDR